MEKPFLPRHRTEFSESITSSMKMKLVKKGSAIDPMKKVAVIMGSKSDLDKVLPAVKTLKELGIGCEVRVMSAHRTPDEAANFSKNARANGFGVIIACAGMAAHLGGVLAAYTTLPVIGVPIRSSFDGMDALLATVQMPSGVPVATVAVDGSKNAALLAAQILAVGDDSLARRLQAQKEEMKESIAKADAAVQQELKNL